MTINIEYEHPRRQMRLKGRDYTGSGLYFITICLYGRSRLLGEIKDGKMFLNMAGRMVEGVWLGLVNRFPGVALDEYVVMPDHFHGILNVGATLVVARKTNGATARAGIGRIRTAGDLMRAGTRPAPTISAMVGTFKSATTVAYGRLARRGLAHPFTNKLWQRGYYDRIIRNRDELNRIREYIVSNPSNWSKML